MGVRGLQTFVRKNVPEGILPNVNIEQEIQHWKCINNQESPVIVFDLMGMLRVFDETPNVFAGRHQIIAENYERFLEKLVGFGAKLAFFVDGPVQKDKLPTWLGRQQEKYSKILKLYDAIEAGMKLVDIDDQLFPGMTIHLPTMFHLSLKYSYYFHVSLYNECDAVIAQYATRNNALAIVAEDSDFFIFEGNWKLWSANDLNHQTFTTTEYNRPALRKYLGLSQLQMPLFATIGGNDYIPYDDLKHFHWSLGYRWNKFPNVATIVRRICKVSSALSDADLHDIAFNTMQLRRADAVHLMRTSLQSYSIDFEIKSDSDPLLQMVAHRSALHSFLIGKPQTITLGYTDLRRKDFMPYSDIVFPIYRRQSGIMLKHKNDPSLEIKNYAKMSHEAPFKAANYMPEYPTFDIPPLLELLNEDSLVPDQVRWSILRWTISVHKIEAPILTDIFKGYRTAILTLNFLLKLNQITITEADGILITIVKANRKEIELKLPYPKTLDAGSVMICNLYCKVHNTIYRSFSIAGLSRMADLISFDGLYYSNLIRKLKSASAEAYKTMIEIILDLRIYAE